MQLPVNKINELLSYKINYVSLSENVYDSDSKGDTDVTYERIISNSNNFNEIIKKMLTIDIEILLKNSSLNKEEIEFIKLRYGFYDNSMHSLAELSRIYNVTLECIRQKEIRILRKIIQSSIIEDYVSYLDNPQTALKNIRILRKEYKNKKNNMHSVDYILKRI